MAFKQSYCFGIVVKILLIIGILIEESHQISSKKLINNLAQLSLGQSEDIEEYAAKSILLDVAKSRRDKKAFAIELLKTLHEQYALPGSKQSNLPAMEEARSISSSSRQSVSNQLLNALNADGDLSRLIDWVQNSFNLASVGELTTQFVVGKLGSINCAAILKPDNEETLIPRFLLFNEHFQDVPYELSAQIQQPQDCQAIRFDSMRKTVLILHGYLGGYTIVDGLTNIKNRMVDLNKIIIEKTISSELRRGNASHLFNHQISDDLRAQIRRQQYNVIIVDWFNGANPVVRSRYIRAAVNAQVVGQIIARFLMSLVKQCRTSASRIQMLAHSLGCHVAGFTGKHFSYITGQRLGKITHLDPVGLCFGRMFSQPKYRLSPDDALETQAIHVSLNLFDNPLDGAHANILVNGGRDQIGCGGQSELKNSTSSSASLLFDSETKFNPCSHMRALSLYEDDLSSSGLSGKEQCQIVGYKCSTYDKFLSGKCGFCDQQNSQCRLMGLPTIDRLNFRGLNPLKEQDNPYKQLTTMYRSNHDEIDNSAAIVATTAPSTPLTSLVSNISDGTIAWVIDDKELNEKIGDTVAKIKPELIVHNNSEDQSHLNQIVGKRSDKTDNDELSSADLLLKTIDKFKSEARSVLSGLGGSEASSFKVNTVVNHQNLLSTESMESLPKEHESSDDSIIDPIPLGGQALPVGSVNSPLYFVGTSSMSPYCTNYYQFKILIAEWRISRLLNKNALAATPLVTINNDQALPTIQLNGNHQRQQTLKDKLHLTVKLTDSNGRFFKGFTLLENARLLTRANFRETHKKLRPQQPMLELTMLLNTTRLEPVRISETVISYYFHKIVLADLVQVNYMSSISPEIRARYSSKLCPIAINDKHQLVRYAECGTQTDTAARINL